jgi:hypothetical protein
MAMGFPSPLTLHLDNVSGLTNGAANVATARTKREIGRSNAHHYCEKRVEEATNQNLGKECRNFRRDVG